MKQIGFVLFAILISVASIAQIGMGTSTPNSKSLLDLSSTDKGLLTPRMTAIQRLGINPSMPTRGLLVFDTDSTAFMFWTGTAWQRLGSNGSTVASNSWSLNGNTLTGVEKFGSLNNYPLELIVNNRAALRLEYAVSGTLAIPNIIGGNTGNSVVGGYGNTIAGGGYSPTVYNGINNGNHNFIGSGSDNQIYDHSKGVIISGSSNKIQTVDGLEGSFIGTGLKNSIQGGYGFIGSGESDSILAARGTILNGLRNKVMQGANATILNGQNNIANGAYALIGTGDFNHAETGRATILNGSNNYINGSFGLIGNGENHKILSNKSVILNGDNNNISIFSHAYATIINGKGNNVANENAFIASGDSNSINFNSNFAFIGNGSKNVIFGDYGFIGNGINNKVNGLFSVLGGGQLNRIEKTYSVIGGGLNNWSRGDYSAILGGNTNEAGGDYGVVLGGAGNTAGEEYASVLGGRFNQAFGSYSVASGYKSNIVHSSNFMYAVFRVFGTSFDSKNQGQFLVRVLNGALFTDEDTSTVVRAQLHARSEGSTTQLMADQVGDDFARIRLRSFNALTNHWDIAAKASDAEFNIFRNGTGNILKLTPTSASNLLSMSNGARLTAGGTWTNASDRNVKDNISQIDGEEILEKLAALPVTEWHYKTEAENVTHIGPMAQDFKTAFGLGDSDKSITTVDADGVNMAAIQALYKRLLALEKQNVALVQEIKKLKQGKR